MARVLSDAMEPPLPARRPDGPGDDPFDPQRPAYDVGADVGAFEQGSPFSRWALARYVVGRVILERVSWSLLVLALVFFALAAVSQFVLHVTLLTVLLVIVAVMVLLMRALLQAVLRRLMGAKAYGPLEEQLSGIVSGAGSDVLAELHRVGLPSRTLTLPLIAVRLIGKRRAETMTRLREFEVERAVSRARLDELHMLLRTATGAGGAPGSRPSGEQPGPFGPVA